MTVDSSPGRGMGRFGELAADALRYWEPRRVLYNLALIGVVFAHFFAGWPDSRPFLHRDALFGFFILAVLANIAYCAAYPVDLFVQFSAVRQAWGRRRWILLLVGTAFAAMLAHFFMLGVLGGPIHP